MTYEARAELKLVFAMPCKKEEDEESNDNKRRNTRTAAYVLFRR